MIAKDVQEAVAVQFCNHKYVLTNSYIFNWESDFFSITSSDTVYEVEIKVDRADYFRDFDKPKHLLFKHSKDKIYMDKYPDELERGDAYNQYVHKDEKGNQSYRFAPFCRVQWHDPSKFYIPNKFYFAVPKGLIFLDEVPWYAGLLEVDPVCGYAAIRKHAPFLHKRPMMQGLFLYTLLNKFYYLSINQGHVIRNLKDSIKYSKKTIEL